jgi:hypothetical protein
VGSAIPDFVYTPNGVEAKFTFQTVIALQFNQIKWDGAANLVDMGLTSS